MRNLIPHFIHEQFQQHVYSGTFQAATLFVDISGFTQLTETLMQHRKDGAEVLSEALEAIFSPLVSQVYNHGGLISVFAGDAFTAIFPHEQTATPNAPLHALLTAFSIQSFFNPQSQNRTFPTEYGAFVIGVKVGLSYGSVRWGIPGQEGRFRFYFRGPAVDGCALVEQQAVRGQIIADDRILPWIQGYVTTEPVADTAFHRLTSCSLDLPALDIRVPQLSRFDLAPFVGEAVLDLAAKAEFREVCPVFLSFEEPAEEAPLHQFLAAALVLAEEYGATLSQVDFGDKGGMVVLWFGAPVSYENNMERAAEFLLALQRQDWVLRWRAGLTFGIVWAGIRGGAERCEYSPVGDVVNLAARLAVNAGWGEIWATAPVYERLRGAYQLEGRGAFRFKGKSREIPVYLLGGKKEQAETVFHTGAMIGRDVELEQLTACVQPIFANQFAGLIYIYGGAGAGKSRLAYELRQRLTAEMKVHWFFCPADQILRQSLNPFKRFLRRYFDQSRDRSAEANMACFNTALDALVADLRTPVFSEKPGVLEVMDELERTRSFLAALIDLRWEGSLYEELEPRLRFDNTLAAFKILVLAESLRRPVVLQLEDLHWLDADSQDLLELLTRNVEGYPLVIVCTSRYRDDGSRVTLAVDPGVPQQVVELDTLLPEDVQALAVQMLDGEIADELAAYLREKTGGNPFFVEQLVLDLRERGAVVKSAEGQWSIVAEEMVEVPTTIGAVLIARLDRLVVQLKEVVQTAAVLGREFEIQILSRMLQADERLPVQVKQGETERIWSALSEVRYIFRHALLRDAAYDMQLRARLRELHALAGGALEQVYATELPPHYADLVYHYGRAEDAERERHYAKLAGEQAAAQFANEEAVRHFNRALELTEDDHLEERCILLLAREEVHDLQSAREAQSQDLEALKELIDTLDHARLDVKEHRQATKRRGEVALRQAQYANATGNYPAAIEVAQQAIHLAQAAQDVELEAVSHRHWGRALWRQGSYDAARMRLKVALELARGVSLHEVEAESLHDFGLVSVHQGDLDEALAQFDKALELFIQVGDRRGEGRARNSLGLVFRQQGHYAEAKMCHEESLSIFRQIGDRRGEAMVLNNLGIVSRLHGDYGQARAFYEQALLTQREIADRWNEGVTLNNLGNIHRLQGEYSQAKACLKQALRIHREIGNRQSEDMSLENLGVVCLHQGEYVSAKAFFEQSLRICREVGDRQGEAFGFGYLGTVFQALGDYGEAKTYFEQLLDLSREIGYPRAKEFGLAGLSLTFHYLGDDQAARECGQRALSTAKDLGDRSGQGNALIRLGHAQLGLGLSAEAAMSYRQALALRRELGEHHRTMEPLAGLARVYLAQGSLSQALACVEEILSYVETSALDGMGEPSRVFLTCYRVLCSAQDPRAQEILATACDQIQEQADSIRDDEIRRSFLENVAANRALMEAWQAYQRKVEP